VDTPSIKTKLQSLLDEHRGSHGVEEMIERVEKGMHKQLEDVELQVLAPSLHFGVSAMSLTRAQLKDWADRLSAKDLELSKAHDQAHHLTERNLELHRENQRLLTEVTAHASPARKQLPT
jgi:hypothetical protein